MSYSMNHLTLPGVKSSIQGDCLFSFADMLVTITLDLLTFKTEGSWALLSSLHTNEEW